VALIRFAAMRLRRLASGTDSRRALQSRKSSARSFAPLALIRFAAMLSTPVENLTVPPIENLTHRRGDEPQFVDAS
jgi:hypothetical protein